MTQPVINLMLDSGAYTAWTKGKPISLSAYIEFIKQNSADIAHVVNLDVINPGNPEVAAAAGWANFQEMRDAGINTIPVYHAREALKWLDKMVEACGYVGISGTSLVSPLEVYHFYDIAYQYLTDAAGCPIIDTHLFGDTSPNSLLNYPCTSADSATWMIQSGRAARVNLDGKSIQLHSSKIRDTSYICASDSGPKRQSWEEAFIRLGFNPERVMNVQAKQSERAMIRAAMVLAELLRLQERAKECTRFKKATALISTKKQQEGGKERVGPPMLYCVISPSAWYFNFAVIASLNIKHILVSYHYVNDAPRSFWTERLVPFLHDPMGFAESNPKVKRYMDKLREVLLPKENSNGNGNDSPSETNNLCSEVPQV